MIPFDRHTVETSPDTYAVEITQHLRESNLATDEELTLIATYLLS